MNGGSKQQTTTTNNAPWGAAQPALKTGLDQALKLFNADPTGKNSVYTGSTVVPWSNQTKNAMSGMENIAYGNAGGRGASGEYRDIINQGGYNDQQKQASNALSGIVGGSGLSSAQQNAMNGMQGTINQGGYNAAQKAALNSAQGMLGGNGLSAAQQSALGGLQALGRDPFNSFQDAALKNTQNVANSNFDINANPAFQQVLQQAQNAARDSVNMSAGGSGRYGSGVHQGNLASEVGDLTSRMVGSEYQNWQNRRDTANQNLFNMGQTGIGTQMNAQTGAANIGQQGVGNLQNAQNSVYQMGQGAQSNLANAQNSLFNMGQTGLSNRMGAAGNLYQMGQGAIGNLGAAYQGLRQPAQDLMQVGAMKEDLSTRQLNDRLRLFNDQQNAPWNQLSRLNAIASGAGSLGGTQTSAQPGQNPFLSALGYGATGLGLLGGLF